jgi:hypothetical protein
MNRPHNSPEDFSRSFETAFAHLQVVIEKACRTQTEWPLKVAAAIDAGLRFAASDPLAVQTLTNEALAHGMDGIARHERLIAWLTEGLLPGCAERAEEARLPEITEHAMASGVVMLVVQRIDRGKQAELPGIASEAIQFVLTPYLGADAARRIGAEHAPESPQGS